MTLQITLTTSYNIVGLFKAFTPFPFLQLGGGGGLKISEKSLLGVEGQKFLFWLGEGGGNIV